MLHAYLPEVGPSGLPPSMRMASSSAVDGRLDHRAQLLLPDCVGRLGAAGEHHDGLFVERSLRMPERQDRHGTRV